MSNHGIEIGEYSHWGDEFIKISRDPKKYTDKDIKELSRKCIEDIKEIELDF